MRLIFTIICALAFLTAQAQSTISGTLQESDGTEIPFANIALYKSADSNLVKVESSDLEGKFKIQNIDNGNYYLKATYVGFNDYVQTNINFTAIENLDLGIIKLEEQTQGIDEVTIVAKRQLVEVKPDRTVFNVEGTVNSVGSDAIELLRKAPSVTVDNNDNINILGRSGVIVYVNGKRLPLGGDDLSNYLKNITADQIDRIDIITSPSAKYDAEGNAGIVDIRLKKDANLGGNGSIGGTFTQGILTRYSGSASGNYRNKKANIFGNFGYNGGKSFNQIDSESFQNGIFLVETNDMNYHRNGYNYGFGMDFYVNKKNTIGVLYNGGKSKNDEETLNRITIADAQTQSITDSILVATNTGKRDRLNNSINLNYQFNGDKKQSVNIDLDYGKYKNERDRYQPNTYYDPTETFILQQTISEFETPNDVQIYSAKIDFDKEIGKGQFSVGGKFSRVETANTFKVFNVEEDQSILDNTRSNLFDYRENVYAGYANYARHLDKKKKWNLSLGLRLEQTNVRGDLTAFDPNLQEPPTESKYLSWFPSAGLTWQIAQKHALAMSYGRRINRPDYNVLNPFRNQLSEISIETGNANLLPEIVNNFELGYTVAYKYNFKIAYSRTIDKITRLIGPDDIDPRANYISWDNLATQSIVSFSASLPFSVKGVWDFYLNLGGSYLNNQANYGDGAIVDVQAFTFNLYHQSTFNLPKDFKIELSGWFSSPGIWGGVFEYDANWSLNAGVQKVFFDDRFKVRLAVNNIFNGFGWRGVSRFDGLEATSEGHWDNRYFTASLRYNFGNQNVKSRKRNTGIQNESNRVNGGGGNGN